MLGAERIGWARELIAMIQSGDFRGEHNALIGCEMLG